MDKGPLQKLNSYHVIFLIHMTMSGSYLLSLPHNLSVVGYNLWLIPILFGLLAQFTLLPMVALSERYPDLNLFEMNEELLGKWLGRLLSVIFILYGIITVSGVSETYLLITQVVTLPNRGITGILIVIFAIMVYIVLGGVKSIARFAIAGFFLTAWMLYYLQWGLSKGVFSHLSPLFDFTFSDVITATQQGFPSMLGYELLLFYFPYIIRKKKTHRDVSIGIWITVIIYVLVCVTSVVYFSPWQLENLRFPVLNLYKAVELTFIERIENLGIALWVFLILSTIAIYLWVATKGLDVIFQKSRRTHVYICAFLAFLLIALPYFNNYETEIYQRIGPVIGYCIILYPNLLLLVHSIFGERRKKS